MKKKIKEKMNNCELLRKSGKCKKKKLKLYKCLDCPYNYEIDITEYRAKGYY